jgi:hypothetical protein
VTTAHDNFSVDCKEDLRQQARKRK